MRKIIKNEDVISFCKEFGIDITCEFNPSKELIKEIQEKTIKDELFKKYFGFSTAQINTLGNLVLKLKNENEELKRKIGQLQRN